MEELTLIQRAEFYSKTFPKWPPLRADDRWLDGMWVLGNNYRGSGFYGAYPPNYLKRIMSIFPDAISILHLFSGSLKSVIGTTFDSNSSLKPDKIGNAESLSEYFKKGDFDLILADPPYSQQDALKYGTPMISRNKVLKECAKVLCRNGYLVWLDQVLPMFRKDEFLLCGLIGIVRSTNHRFRIVSIFKALN